MNDGKHTEDRLSRMEQNAIDSLRKDLVLPDYLEKKVIEQLKQNHLINITMKMKSFYWAAAVLTALVAGFFFGKADLSFFSETQNIKAMTDTKEKFLLLLYEDETFDAENIAALVEEYSNWAKDMHAKGQLAYAEKLKDEKFDYGNMPDGFSSSITGYFVIKADNQKEAMRIVKDHPHLKYNGGIELRQIDKLD